MFSPKINTYISTLNLILILVGYQLVTTILLPHTTPEVGTPEELSLSRTVTVPYRLFALFSSLCVIALNYGRRLKMNYGQALFLVFWFFWAIRVVYDLEVRTDLVVSEGKAQYTIIMMFMVCIVSIISILKSYKSIDYDMAFKCVFVAHIILVPVFQYDNPMLFAYEVDAVRMSGNVGMYTITFGHYGVTLALLAIYYMVNSRGLWKKIFCVCLILVGTFVMLRAGSRGPLVALIATFLFCFIARQRSPIVAICIAAPLLLLFVAMNDMIFDIIQMASPIMAERITPSGSVSQYAELTTGRSELYAIAFNKFSNHPIFGDSFAIFFPDSDFTHSHNIVLDAFMGLGLFGGIAMMVVLLTALTKCFFMVHHQEKNWWIAILCVQYIVFYQLSRTFYTSEVFNSLLTLVLCWSPKGFFGNSSAKNFNTSKAE